MSLTTRAGLLAGAAALTLSGVAIADTTTDANTDDLRAQVKQLQSKINELESRQGDNWLTEKRAGEIRSLVHDVLADADTRASLLSSGMQAGYDGGFTIGDSTGNFLLRINGQLQTRWIYSNQGHSTGAAGLGGGFAAEDFLWDAGIGDWSLIALINNEGGESLAEVLDNAGETNLADFLTNHANGPYADLEAYLLGEFGFDLNDPADVEALEALFLGLTPNVAAIRELLGLHVFGGHASHLFGLMPHLTVGTEGDEHRSGFENARTKLWFTGHVINPNWQYHIEGDFGSFGGFTLRDAYIAHDYGNGFKMIIGQFKLPFLGEELVDSRYQQAVERSLVNSYFTTGRSQGVMVAWEPEGMFRGWASFSDGMNQDNTPWNNGPTGGSTEWSFTARAEVLLAGNWDQFHEFRSAPGEEFAARIGGAIHYQDGEYGTAFFPETEVLGLTVDGMAKFGGFNLYGAFIYRNLDFDTAGMSDLDQIGAIVQGGFHLTPEWEIFGRYEYADLDLPDLTVLGVPVYSFDELHLLTFGFNHYLLGSDAGHSAKWTTDIGYAFNRVEVTDTRTGWRSDFGGDDGQFVFRSQLQLAF